MVAQRPGQKWVPTCYNEVGGLLVIQMDGHQRVWPVQGHGDGQLLAIPQNVQLR